MSAQNIRDFEQELMDQGHSRSKAKKLALRKWNNYKDPYSFRGPKIHDRIQMHRDPTGELAVSRVLSS